MLFELGVNFLDEVRDATCAIGRPPMPASSPTSRRCAPRAARRPIRCSGCCSRSAATAMLANWCLLAPAPDRAHEPAVSLLFPELLLLIVPLLFLYFWRGRSSGARRHRARR